jgi:hypothetical protein
VDVLARYRKSGVVAIANASKFPKSRIRSPLKGEQRIMTATDKLGVSGHHPYTDLKKQFFGSSKGSKDFGFSFS